MKPTFQTTHQRIRKTRPMQTVADSRGYSLIEILMVMSIFSIGILAIMTLQITAINSNANARKIMLGSTRLADQFEKLISMDYESAELTPGKTTTRIESGYLIEHTVSTTLVANIKKIDLTVTMNAPAGRPITVTYYKANLF